MLIYIAGPLSAETDDERMDNVAQACAAGKALLDLGHAPVIPHLNLLYALWHAENHGAEPDYETFMAWDAAILLRCEGLLYLGPSPGADRELALAEQMGLPVFRSLEEIMPGLEPLGSGHYLAMAGV